MTRKISEKFSQCHLIVIGDVMLDEYIESQVSRISPEAPVPIAAVQDRWCVPGGAANVARNLISLGCQVTLLGLCGQDSSAEILSKTLATAGLEDNLTRSPYRKTTRKQRIVAKGHQLLRLDEEDNLPLQKAEYEDLLAKFKDALATANAVIISDYAKGMFTLGPASISLAQTIIQLCQADGKPTFIDPKGLDWDRYHGAFCITPNTAEISSVLGHNCNERHSLEQYVPELLARLNCASLLVTRASRGLALFQKGHNPIFIKANALQTIDVSGAGDTVIATFALCMACGLSLGESAKLANAAAGIVVQKMGTATLSQTEFDFVSQEKESFVNPKIMDLRQLQENLAFWRRQGDRIVFTNGCFDIIHTGHIQLLREAAAQGERLIVALNSDASVKRLKGPERPIQDEQSRAQVLASIQWVDAVILFSQDTPKELIEALIPDVLVKGADYTVENIVGADTVLTHGGKVYLVALQPDRSTTKIWNHIRKTQES